MRSHALGPFFHVLLHGVGLSLLLVALLLGHFVRSHTGRSLLHVFFHSCFLLLRREFLLLLLSHVRSDTLGSLLHVLSHCIRGGFILSQDGCCHGKRRDQQRVESSVHL